MSKKWESIMCPSDMGVKAASSDRKANKDTAANDDALFHISNQFSSKLSARQIERINERELLSLYALLAYVAENQNLRQDTIQLILEAEFRVDHVSKIRREDYHRAVAFLVDIKVDDKIN